MSMFEPKIELDNLFQHIKFAKNKVSEFMRTSNPDDDLINTVTTILDISLEMMLLLELNHKNLPENILLKIAKQYMFAIGRMFDTDIMIAIEIIIDEELEPAEQNQKMNKKIDRYFEKINMNNSEKFKYALHGLRIIRNTCAHSNTRIKGNDDKKMIKKIVDEKIPLGIVLLENYEINYTTEHYVEVIELLKKFLAEPKQKSI